MACFDSGYCPDCGDCLDCYGDEYCAISGNFHGDYLPDAETEDAARWQPESGTHPRNMTSSQFEEWFGGIVRATRERLAATPNPEGVGDTPK